MRQLVLALALAAGPTRVAVVDVSEPDAVYEDVSRTLADEVVGALQAAGFDAVRVTEDELPEAGCRAGPCLKDAARLKGAQVLVAVDATERGAAVAVQVMALAAHNGLPLAGQRYTQGKKARRKLAEFTAALARALQRPDAGH